MAMDGQERLTLRCTAEHRLGNAWQSSARSDVRPGRGGECGDGNPSARRAEELLIALYANDRSHFRDMAARTLTYATTAIPTISPLC